MKIVTFKTAIKDTSQFSSFEAGFRKLRREIFLVFDEKIEWRFFIEIVAKKSTLKNRPKISHKNSIKNRPKGSLKKSIFKSFNFQFCFLKIHNTNCSIFIKSNQLNKFEIMTNFFTHKKKTRKNIIHSTRSNQCQHAATISSKKIS